jgi:putative transcriptional regulator
LAKEVPPVVAKLIRKPSELNWKRLSPSVQTAKLKTGQFEYEASLIKIKAGGRTLEHNHRGNEFTVVIKGAFSDHNSRYEQGDFVHCKPGDVHTPAATADADCLCLALVDAPLKFTGWVGSVINPFMRISAQ